jgi:Domain of unknown function (DUF4389)
MKVTIKHQDHFSRGELLLRLFFGWLYIGIPHYFLLFFMSIWGSILYLVSFLIILFTGSYPKSMFEYQLGLMKWSNRLTARFLNLSDGYPSFGINGTDKHTDIEIAYPETVSRGHTLLRFFLGWIYVGLPHGFILFFRMFAVWFLLFIAFWIVLFTGNFPKGMHNFNAGLIRWSSRLKAYLYFMTENYPPFTGDDVDYK